MGIPLKVLLIEDSEDDSELVIRQIRKGGYDPQYLRIDSEPALRKALDEQGWDIVLCDYSLPRFSGGEALKIFKKYSLEIPFIVISGNIGEEVAVEMMRGGASDYLMKDKLARLVPAIQRELEEFAVRRNSRIIEENLKDSELKFSLFMDFLPLQVLIEDAYGEIRYLNRKAQEMVEQEEDFEQSIPTFLSKIASHKGNQNGSNELEEYPSHHVLNVPGKDGGKVVEIIRFQIPQGEKQSPLLGSIAWDITERQRAEERARQAAHELAQAYDATLEGWSRALELREKETAGHSNRVVELTLLLADKFSFSPEEKVHIRRGTILHDIGKMGVPDHILLKPGPLSDDEWVIMRQHPVYAYQLLSRIPYMISALDIPYCHHERMDGSGYPRGLKGEEIPLPGRIFAVVDVWDALTTNRPYRPAWTQEAALAYINQHAGDHFDSKVVAVFNELIQNKFKNWNDSLS
jgi:HD-GYP domain-containing protein (c-di-GMP phosphodiesterase class II)/CheY-like chemotaxis protein